jgi:hypothetical protein
MSESIPKLKDKVWKKKLEKPIPKWHVNQGDSNDCGPFCISMITNGMRDAYIVNPDQLARELETGLEAYHYLLPQRIKGWATFPWGVVNALRRLGIQAHWRAGVSEAHLLKNLDANRPTVVIIGQPLAFRNKKYWGWSHYKIVYAYADDEWAFVDPGAKSAVVFSYQDVESFSKQWTNMGRIIIEVCDGK